MLECRYVNNEAARPSAVEESLVKTEQQLYHSEVLVYCTVLYCTAPLQGAAHAPRQPPAVPLRGDEAQVCRLSYRRANRGQDWLAKILEVSYDLIFALVSQFPGRL